MKKIFLGIIITLCILSPCCVASADGIGMDIYENGMSREEYYQQTIGQYSQFDYSDPQTTTDEELFGEWNGQEWTTEPLLDYERVPGLSEVEEAAKNADGNYDECKRLILAYYNEKFDNYNLGTDSTSYTGDKYRLTLEMQMENFFVRPEYGPYPLSKMSVSGDEKWHTSTVLNAVTRIISASDKRVTLHIYALKKDGYTVKFNSLNSGINVPYIEATVNGTARRFYAVMDTYVSAGDNSKTSYGNENELLVEESYTSISADATSDSYTRRAVLKFDFSDLKETDEVTTATLNLYGHMEKSDNPIDSGIEKESKIVFILNDTSGNLWDENKIRWDYLDDSGWACFSYDGTAGYINQPMTSYFPNLLQYRSSIMSFSHDLDYFAGYAGGTKDETVAYHVLRLMMHKIRELDCQFTSTEQPVLNLIRINSLITIFDKCRFSQYMTPEVFTTMIKCAYEHCEAIVGSERFSNVRARIWEQGLKTSNIGVIQTQALLQVALVFDEFKAAHEPLGELWAEDSYNGGWIAVARDRYKRCLNSSVFPDGSTTDIPIHYMIINMENYTSVLSSWPDKYNIDPYDIFDESIVDEIIVFAEYISNIYNPVHGSWQVGDGRNYATKYISNIKRIADLFPDRVSEHVKYIATKGMSGIPASYTSFAGDYTNRAVLRSDWTTNAVALHIQSNSNQQHTHNDDLGITLMAYGNYLLADPNRYLYLTSDSISNWQMSREAHNSIVVDEQDPVKTGGSLHPENREFNNVYDFIQVDSGGYSSQFMNRYVLFVRPGYFIVTDHIDSIDEESHNYRQNWHFQPNANIMVNDYDQTQTQYLTAANLTVAPVANTNELKNEILTGYYSKNSQSAALEEYNYVTYTKDVTGDTSFQTVLYPTAIGRNSDIQTEVLETSIASPNARAMRAIIKEDAKEITTNYYLLLDPELKDTATFGSFKTDGSMALSEQDNTGTVTTILREGSFVEDVKSNRMILMLANETTDIGISILSGKMVIESSKDDTNIDGMVVFVGDKSISSVEFNGVKINFNKKGKYIFFGTEPVHEIPNENEGNGSSGSSGSSGSGGSGGSSGSDDSTYVPKDEVSNGNMNSVNENTESSDETSADDTKLSDSFDSELNNYWGKDEVAYMIDNGYVKGSDGKLNLEQNITRAEFVAVISRMLRLPAEEYQSCFSDVTENDWFATEMESAYRAGLVSGYNGSSNARSNITREQVAKILVNALEFKLGESDDVDYKEYVDSNEMSSWSPEYISKCTALGMMKGYVDGSFKPLSNITRGEAFVTLCRLLKNIE